MMIITIIVSIIIITRHNLVASNEEAFRSILGDKTSLTLIFDNKTWPWKQSRVTVLFKSFLFVLLRCFFNTCIYSNWDRKGLTFLPQAPIVYKFFIVLDISEEESFRSRHLISLLWPFNEIWKVEYCLVNHFEHFSSILL